ncbi:MAG: hypothetical protein KDD28_18210 [Phaeodactylibacter sp.]|nr:hypothetical protein [Phaeodactylibacter sp.]
MTEVHYTALNPPPLDVFEPVFMAQTQRDAAQHFATDAKTIRKWAKHYKLISPRSKSKIPLPTYEDMAEVMSRDGMTLDLVAEHYGVSQGTISRWAKHYHLRMSDEKEPSTTQPNKLDEVIMAWEMGTPFLTKVQTWPDEARDEVAYNIRECLYRRRVLKERKAQAA